MRALILMLLIITMMSGAAQAEKKIIINLASRTLGLYDGTERLGVYPLGVGKVSTPTPIGYYKILTKEINPPWIDPSNPEYEVPSGANNPLGYRWMQFYGNYGIHGTNRPDSIGHYVSNGCIRMREADVETLFDSVQIGTPVEITYNRVIVERSTDDRIAYYIYPDGYSRQALDTKSVLSWIEPWGISAFVEDSEIKEAISKSEGEPIYIGKAYSIEIDGNTIPATKQNGRNFDAKAVERGGITYLPAVPIAIALEMKLEWRHHTTLATKFGEVTGIEKKGQLYINEDDAGLLFRVEGWKEGRFYKLKKVFEEPAKYGDDNADKKDMDKPLTDDTNTTDKIDTTDTNDKIDTSDTTDKNDKADNTNKVNDGAKKTTKVNNRTSKRVNAPKPIGEVA